MKQEISFIAKTSLSYCGLAFVFSLLGIFLVEKGSVPHQNPITALTLKEVGGHLLWGFIAGAVTVSLRYIILGGLFALLIDSDHLVGLFPIDAISRMSHSISFGIVSAIVVMLIFGKKNYLLGAIAFAGLISHLSYDIFASDEGKFPLLAPFYNNQITLPNTYWLYFEIAAIIIVGITTIFYKKNKP